MAKSKNLTGDMLVTQKQTDCRMTIDANNCMQYVVVCVEPNPADPEKPITTYTIDGVDVPKPDVLLPCLEPGTTTPVYVMGGKLDLGAAVSVDLGSLETLLTEILEEQRKDTPFSKTRYCNQVTGTWWEKLCVVEKQADGSYQTIVVSDEDTFEVCTPPKVCTPRITEVFGATTTPVEFTAIAISSPSCCIVTIDTSAGEFTVTANEPGWEEHFNCPVTLNSIKISGTDCDPAKVHTLLTMR